LISILANLLLVLLTDFIVIEQPTTGLTYELHLTEKSNPLGIALLSKKSCCAVHKGCYSNLLSAGQDAESQGYLLKIVDALRPLYVQQALFAVISDPKFVSQAGDKDDLHTRGLSVDILLMDKEGKLLPLPTPYMETTPRAFSDYRDCTEEERQNREILSDIMTRNGFKQHPNRWWEFMSTYWDTLSSVEKEHFSLFNFSLEELNIP